MLAKAIHDIYFACSRKKWFLREHMIINYDLFTIEPEEISGLFLFQHLIDGQECRLDWKYSRIFTKNANMPIILIGRRLTLTCTFKKRFTGPPSP
jgi:hypothetical protein